MVNPDGVEYGGAGWDGWRKNCAPNYNSKGEIVSYGVDLNRNYAYKWLLYYIFPNRYNFAMTSNKNSWNYRGEFPFSENETKAVKNFVENHDIKISLSYHSYGEFMLYPWMHTSMPTPDEVLFKSIGYNMSQINGYELMVHGIYGNRDYIIPRFGGTLGTSENWLYGEHGIISFTIELCKTRIPTNRDTVNDYCFKNLGVVLYICETSQNLKK
jgi:hypothetical protein